MFYVSGRRDVGNGLDDSGNAGNSIGVESIASFFVFYTCTYIMV